MLQAENLLVLKLENNVFSARYSRELSGRIAFRIFCNDELVDKRPYGDEGKCDFSTITVRPGEWQVRAYLKSGEKVVRLLSNRVLVKSKEYLAMDEDDIDPRYFEIRQFADYQKEIRDFFSSGFVAMGRHDLKPWKTSLPIAWLEDPYRDRNWMFQLQAWRMLDPFLRRFTSDDIAYISSVINDWVEYELRHANHGAKWLWYDMSTGLRALKLAYFLLRCAHEDKQNLINKLEYLLTQHIEHLSNKRELSSGNHGLFQLNGLMSLVWACERHTDLTTINGLQKAKSFAVSEMGGLLSRQLGEHGVHTEDSPDYHFFAVKKINDLLAAPWWECVELGGVKSLLEKSNAAKYWLVAPSGECVPVGDSTRSIKIKEWSGIDSWPNTKSGSLIAAQLDGYAVVRSAPEFPLKQSSFLFFQGSFHSGAHKHSDCLSFVWQEKGRYILIDSGKYGYQSDRFRSYFQSSIAHNTVTVDGISPSRSGRDAYGSAVEFSPINISGYWVLAGKVKRAALAYEHRRVLIYRPGQALYVVDYLSSQKPNLQPRKVEIAWHFDTSFSVDRGTQLITASDEQADIRVVMRTQSAEGSLSVDICRGKDTGTELLGWVSNAYLKYDPTTSVVLQGSVVNRNIFVTRFLVNCDEADALIEIEDGRIFCHDQKLAKLLNAYEIRSSKKNSKSSLESFSCQVANHYSKLPYFRYKGVAHCLVPSNGSNKLFVSFHGSIKPPRADEQGSPLPVFRLHDLKVEHQPHVLCFSDMLLDFYKDDGVYLGWYLDTEKVQQRAVIEEIISHYVEKYSVEHVLFHGSSGGGHIAIDMAARLGGVALISNCQFLLDQHFQFKALFNAIKKNGDQILPFDLKSILRESQGPRRCISYCNLNDYTVPHHNYLDSCLNEIFPGILECHYFEGGIVAREKGIKNHNVGFPDGMHVRGVVARYFAKLADSKG